MTGDMLHLYFPIKSTSSQRQLRSSPQLGAVVVNRLDCSLTVYKHSLPSTTRSLYHLSTSSSSCDPHNIPNQNSGLLETNLSLSCLRLRSLKHLHVFHARVELGCCSLSKQAQYMNSCFHEVEFVLFKSELRITFARFLSFARTLKYQVCPCVFQGRCDFFRG